MFSCILLNRLNPNMLLGSPPHFCPSKITFPLVQSVFHHDSIMRCLLGGSSWIKWWWSPRLHVRHLGEAAKRPRRRRPRRPHRTCPPEILEVDRFPFDRWEFLRIFTETISLELFHGVYGCVGKNGRIMVTIMWILPAVHDSWNWWRFARWFTNPHTWCKSKPSMKPLYRQRGAWELMWNHCTKQCYLFASFHFLQYSALRWPEWFSNIFHLVNGCGAAGELGWILCHRGKTWDEWGLVRQNHQWDSKDHEWYPYHQAFMTHGTHGLWNFSLMEQRPWHRWSTHVNINGIPFCSHQNNWDLWMFIPPFSLVISELVTFDYQKNYPNYYPTWSQ